MQVKLEDANGFLEPGKSVTLSSSGSDMQVSSQSGPADRQGEATFTPTDTVAESAP